MTERDDRSPRLVGTRSEEHTSELQSLAYLVCRLLLEKKKTNRQLDIVPTSQPLQPLAPQIPPPPHSYANRLRAYFRRSALPYSIAHSSAPRRTAPRVR